MFGWHDFVVGGGGGEVARCCLELLAELLIVEENPWIPVLAIPAVFQLAHTLHDTLQLAIPHQTDKRGSGFPVLVAQRGYAIPQIFTLSRAGFRPSILPILLEPFDRIDFWLRPEEPASLKERGCAVPILLRCSMGSRAEDLVRIAHAESLW